MLQLALRQKNTCTRFGGCIMEERLKEESEKKVQIEINPLTGLYYNQSFFEMAESYLSDTGSEAKIMVAVDIEHFRLFNKLYGREAGDELLIYVSGCLQSVQKKYGGIIGYLGGDNFALIIRNKLDYVRELKRAITAGVKQWSNTVGFLPAFGVSYIEEEIPVLTMYDRATIALTHVMGNYSKRISIYDSGMEEKLEEELKLLTEIQEGLEKEEFTFFVQPQCDIITGKIVGGESLVRWIHPTRGMISPGIFIPVLEKNGFIADVDRYVWKMVCEWLRSLLDRGYQPVPVSINVSRIDIFSMDVPAYLINLLEHNQLSAKYLKVEITESAYAESDDKIFRTITELRDAGFIVMMDDFGSGYSSLNMLKSVSVDVLKIDMKFLEIDDNEEEKGIGILESVVNMAKTMGLPVIVEGVETQTQENFLLKLGCGYTQGYYYYKPLCIDDFEELLCDERNLDFDGLWCKQVESLHMREFLDGNLLNDTVFNNILGAAAFYDLYENQLTITRVNEQYYQLAGVSTGKEAAYSKKIWNHVRDDDRQVLFSLFEQAYENPTSGAQGYIHFLRTDGKELWVYLRIVFLKEKKGHKLFYSSLEDMTRYTDRQCESRFSMRAVQELTMHQRNLLDNYYGDMPFGFCVISVESNKENRATDYDFVYVNPEIEKLCNGNMERLRKMATLTFSGMRDEIEEKVYRAAFLGENVNHYIYNPQMGHYLKLTFYQFEYGYMACVVSDETHAHIYEYALHGMMLSYREVYFVHLQDNYCRMIYPDDNHLLERGNYESTVNRHFASGKVLPYDEDAVRQFLSLEHLQQELQKKDTVEYKYRRLSPDNIEEWCLTSVIVTERKKGIPKTAIITIRSIDALMREEEQRRRLRMAETLASMSDGFFIYRAAEDEKILYANPTVLKIFGCETMDEFRVLVGNSFKGMVYNEDLERVEWEIKEQIRYSEKNMDYIRYRILRRDGSIRWIDDCGHLEDSDSGEDCGLFYVFISDITDSMSTEQEQRMMKRSKKFNKDKQY